MLLLISILASSVLNHSQAFSLNMHAVSDQTMGSLGMGLVEACASMFRFALIVAVRYWSRLELVSYFYCVIL